MRLSQVQAPKRRRFQIKISGRENEWQHCYLQMVSIGRIICALDLKGINWEMYVSEEEDSKGIWQWKVLSRPVKDENGVWSVEVEPCGQPIEEEKADGN